MGRLGSASGDADFVRFHSLKLLSPWWVMEVMPPWSPLSTGRQSSFLVLRERCSFLLCELLVSFSSFRSISLWSLSITLYCR